MSKKYTQDDVKKLVNEVIKLEIENLSMTRPRVVEEIKELIKRKVKK